MRNTLMILSKLEQMQFFPATNTACLHRLLPEIKLFDPLLVPPEDIFAYINHRRPEIVISGWKTPSLPESLLHKNIKPMSYLCHAGGSVRELVPRKFIESGVLVTNWGSSVCRNVAECALLLVLSALRRAAYWNIQMHCKGDWKDNDTLITESLIGRRVGIHGFGMIAQSLLPMLKPFDVSVTAHSDWESDEKFEEFGVKRANTLEELFSNSDIVIELAPAISRYYHIVDEKLLRMIPAGGVFVNIGRGSTVDTDALIKIAREGQLQIALDVYEVEPLDTDSPLRGMPNVTLLPHLGGPTVDFRHNCGKFILENIEHYLKGEPVEAIVNLDIYDKAT